MDLNQACELPRGDFVLISQLFKKRHVKKFRSRYAHANPLLREFGVDVGFQADFGEGAVFEEALVVAVVS